MAACPTKPNALALYPDVVAASTPSATTPQSPELPDASRSMPQQEAKPHTSYVAEPALLLHPTASSHGASKLLLVAAQQQCGVTAAADAQKLAAADMCMSEGLQSGSLVWLNDHPAAGGVCAQRAGMTAAWQPRGPQPPQCIITEEGMQLRPVEHVARLEQRRKHLQCSSICTIRMFIETSPSECPVPAAGPEAVVPDEPDASDLTPLQCAASLDFWLLFVVFGIGAGCGLMLINNLGTVSVDARLA